jgi:hypothetical protein
MFGNNPFGALATEPAQNNAAAGPSARRVEGEDVDVDVSAGSR